jgi:hypothetical protein
MSATVQIVSYYGDPLVKAANVTSQRYNTAIPSQRDPGLSYPNNVPASGQTNRSCWVFTGAEIVGGSYSQLTNWRWGTTGTIKSAWGLGAGYVQVALKDGGADPGCPFASLKSPTGVAGQYGYDIKEKTSTRGIPYYYDETIACADADIYTTTNPLVFDTNVYTPASSSKITLFVTHQLVLKDDTAFGEKTEINCFIRWQEI